MTPRRRTALLLVTGLALATTLWAQAQGRITGTVTDPDGKPIEGATVTLTAQEITLEVSDTTNRKGRFTIAVVDATKSFVVTIAKEGFQTFSKAVDIPVGDALREDYTLQPAQAGGARVQVEQQAVGGGVNKKAADAYNAGADAFNAGDLETAIQHFEEAAAEAPDLVQALEVLGGLYVEVGRYDDGLGIAEKILAGDPDNLAGTTIRFDALSGLGRNEEAGRVLDRMVELDQGHETAVRLFNAGVTALQSNDLDGAVRRFEQTREIQPDLKEAYQAVGRVYIQQQNYALALERADRLLEIDPGNVTGLSVRYDALRGLGRDEESQQAFAALTEADPEAVGEAFFKQGQEMFDAGNTQASLGLLEKALAARPNHARTHYYLGLAYASAGDTGKAKTHLARFVELAPDDPEAATAREMLKYFD